MTTPPIARTPLVQGAAFHIAFTAATIGILGAWARRCDAARRAR